MRIPRRSDIQQALQALAHLTSRLAGERQRQHLFWRNALLPRKIRDARHQRRGFARSWPGDDERGCLSRGGYALFVVERQRMRRDGRRRVRAGGCGLRIIRDGRRWDREKLVSSIFFPFEITW